MSAVPDLRRAFHDLEAWLEKTPEGTTGEIARGVHAMTPRPRPRHAAAEGALWAELRSRYGRTDGSAPPEWYFALEAELRHEPSFSRLVPDVAGWRRTTTGWPDPDVTPVELMPEWVAEVLSPSTSAFDRGHKSGAYGAMGISWLWLLDPDRLTVEISENVRGQMVLRSTWNEDQSIVTEPFAAPPIPVRSLF
jgi:Uma2 family endonuclease